MDTPQDRVIKKMINNIVESNKPAFEKPATTGTASAPASSESPAPMSTPTLLPEDYVLITRKLEYGFNNLRQENAEMRKLLEELGGGIKLLRNDLDSVRMAVQQRGGSSGVHNTPSAHHDHEEAPRHSSGSAAPQYRKSEADEAYERETGEPSHHDHEEAPASSQARGFAKKDDGSNVDIAKVFYYGKK